MKADILGAVARRLVTNFRNDSGLDIRNRILVASTLFQLARLTDELTAATIDLWLKAMVGQVNGFSQIRLIDVCREFMYQEPEAFRGLWEDNSAPIYFAAHKMRGESDSYRNILRLVLLAVSDECMGFGSNQNISQLSVEVEKPLTPDEWMNLVYLKNDLSRAMNGEFGEFAYSQISGFASESVEISVEVM